MTHYSTKEWRHVFYHFFPNETKKKCQIKRSLDWLEIPPLNKTKRNKNDTDLWNTRDNVKNSFHFRFSFSLVFGFFFVDVSHKIWQTKLKLQIIFDLHHRHQHYHNIDNNNDDVRRKKNIWNFEPFRNSHSFSLSLSLVFCFDVWSKWKEFLESF